MKLRDGCLLLCLFCLGCHSILGLSEDSPVRQEVESWRTASTTNPATSTQPVSKKDEPPRQNHLSLAATLLEKGDDQGACLHLEKYLEANPGHLQVRGYLAELLLEQDRRRDARVHLERFLAEAQKDNATLRDQIQCHCKLMEIAEQEEDDYNVHLHRGIGMYLLALRRAGLEESDELELNCEGLLCKAAGELVHAAALCPEEARPCFYLYAIWWRLAQQHSAEKWLRRAQDTAAFSFLTPCENRQLALAAATWRAGSVNDRKVGLPTEPPGMPRLSLGRPFLSATLPRPRQR